ncbi:hypothetical protein SBRCBS47491_006316 [Sporothrix bragantina]|uniref:Altered inheritance of mitochondria protein 11 n=1 Tax=Sporothrix bragantina TaxID=671064 RepID=A0ABP0C3Y5_9PEZI
MPILASLFKQLLPPDSTKPASETPAPTASGDAYSAASTVPQQPQTSATPPTPPGAPRNAVETTLQPQERDSSLFGARSMKQLGLFFAGAGFLALSTTLTRRAVVRRKLAAELKFYSPSGTGMTTLTGSSASAESAAASATREEAPQGSFMAIEALNLATLNVLSFFLMMTGGFSWALDLSSVDDLRALAQRYTRTPGASGYAKTDEEAEREMEEWVAKILKRPDGTLIGGSKKSDSESANK